MISFLEASVLSQKAAADMCLVEETVQLEESVGRTVAADIYAPLSLQPFDNSAMDGYALRGSDITDASPDTLLRLRIAGIIAAGEDAGGIELPPNACMKIMTGAQMPKHADAVVPFENASTDGEHAIFSAPCPTNDNVRFAGEDFQAGTLIIKKGTLLGTQHVMPLAALGVDKLKVFIKPKIFYISTGKELVDNLDQPLFSGHIYNSNKPYALSFLSDVGAEVIGTKTIYDDPSVFRTCLADALKSKADIIISSGAVSVGDYDFVKTELEEAGAEILFYKVKMKPGKPHLLARLPNGRLYFGLPGNPTSTAVGLRFFIDPIIRNALCQPTICPVKIRSGTAFKKHPGLQMFLKARVHSDKGNGLCVDFLDGQASFMVSPFLNMNAWAVIPEEVGQVNIGDVVDVFLLSNTALSHPPK